jgi:CheY-like chemotaxis protein
MVVEDNEATQATLKRDLETVGVQILQVRSSEEAWQIIDAGSTPNIIILDFHLPGEDGPSFYRKISMDTRFRKVVVIPFTALGEKEDESSIATYGSFLSSRDESVQQIQPVISKNGREDIYKTPPHLYLAVAHALNQQKIVIPDALRKKVREVLREVVDK